MRLYSKEKQEALLKTKNEETLRRLTAQKVGHAQRLRTLGLHPPRTPEHHVPAHAELPSRCARLGDLPMTCLDPQ